MWVVEEDGENGSKYNVRGKTLYKKINKIILAFEERKKINNKEKQVMFRSGKCIKILKKEVKK